MKSKRLCAWLMSLTLLLALLPAAAYGAEGDIASIDGKGYASLQEAFDAVEPGTATKVVLEQSFVTDSVITLAEGKEVTLDLNGETITVTSNFDGRPIRNDGTLTITGEGTMDTSASTTAYGSVDNYGTLVIENGTFTGSVDAGGAVIRNRPYGEVTIYDGWFGGTPTAVYNAGITKIYNGTFDGRSCSACNSKSWGYTIQSHMNDAGCVPELYFYNGTVIGVQGAFSTSAGTSEIHDGTFTTFSCDVHANGSSAWYALYVAGESGQVSTTVYGGTFTSASKYAAYIGNSNDGGDKQDAIAAFKGGTFKSGRADVAIYVDKALGGLEITGGTYLLKDGSVATDAAQWVPEDYEQNEDGSVKHNHASEAKHVADADPTCTETGNKEYWYCPVCDLYFADAACTQEVTLAEMTLPAAGHQYDENGVCTVCGQKQETEAPDAGSPETGDAGQPALWAAVLALCALTGGAVWLNRKKIFG